MSKKNGNNRGKMASSVNSQGKGKDTEFSTEVASKLESKAKKSKRNDNNKKLNSFFFLYT